MKNTLLVLLIFFGCVEKKSKNEFLGQLIPLILNPQAVEAIVDPAEIYLSNIKAGKYTIKPRGEITSLVTSKIKSLGAGAINSPSIQSKVTGNNNNGPQQEGDVDEVWVNIQEIQFISDTGTKFTVPSSVSSVDLIKIKSDAKVLFSRAIVPEGKYTQIRLILNNPNGKVVKNGVEYPLKVPSGNQTGIKLNGEIDLVSGLLLEFTLDFDLHSLKYTPGQGYILTPTIPISNIRTLLPFVHGMLIVKFKNPISLSTGIDGKPITGVVSVDDLISRHNCMIIQKFNDNFPIMDESVSSEVGLDRVYLFHFRQNQDVLLAMFDLAQDANIELVSPNHYMDISETIPNDPDANKNCPSCLRRQETSLSAINAYNGWDITKGKRSVRIAVLDTDIDDEHPDLTGRVTQNRSFYTGKCFHFGIFPYNCTLNTENSKPLILSDGPALHGTFVAGIIGAVTNNGVGISGINWESEILSINIFNKCSDGTFCGTNEVLIGAGIVEAANAGSKVISMSLGGPGYEYCSWGCLQKIFSVPIEFGAVRYANKKRVTLVAAAGNEKQRIYNYPGTISMPGKYPASFNEVISVSALSENGLQLWDGGKPNDGTNYGKIDIAAPGQNIVSMEIKYGDYRLNSGTSLATPMVSAFVGLILALDPNLHPKSVLEAMCANATPVVINDNRGTNSEFVGCGRINLGDTLKTVSNSLPLPKITNNCGGVAETPCSAGRWFETFSFQFTAKDGSAPFKWSYSNGKLPHDSSLNENTGVLSGGPTYWFGEGWTFDITVTDSRRKSDTKRIYFESSL